KRRCKCSLLRLLMWVVITSPRAVQAQAPSGGEHVYRVYCAACHGPRGEGGRGADLTAPRLTRGADDASLARIVIAGIPGTEMPGTRLQESEVSALTVYLPALRRTPPATPGADRARGRELY